MEHRSYYFAVLILAFSLFLPPTAFAHASLLLKSTTSQRSYTIVPNAKGSFTFPNVVPDTYSLSIVGEYDYFSDKATETCPGISVENLHWVITGEGIPASNVRLRCMTATADKLSNPSFNKDVEPNKEYSLTLYSSLVTQKVAALTGKITNFVLHRSDQSKDVMSSR